MGTNRRDFFKQSAFLLGAAGSAHWIGQALGSGKEELRPDYRGPGIESWTNTVCRLCPGGCGIRVRQVDGQPVKIEGNPLSPINRGGLCPMGHSGLQVMFNQERLTKPIKRLGERGEGRWQPIEWDEALDLIANRLIQLQKQGAAHRLALLHQNLRGSMGQLAKHFMQAFGSPNFISAKDQWSETLPFLYLQGSAKRPAYDFEKCGIVVSFGNDFLGTEGPPAWMANIFASLRRRKDKINFIQISSRFSMTAAKADLWLPIQPGTAAALALGIAYVLIVERLYDEDYLSEYTDGFEDWTDEQGIRHQGFKSMIMREYYPEKVSQITGVAVDSIIRLARRLADNYPAIVIAGEEVREQSNGFYSQLAVHSLNALLGSLERPGGVMGQQSTYPSSLPTINEFEQTENQPRLDEYSSRWTLPFSRSLGRFLDNLRNGKPYPLDTLFIYDANPLFAQPKSTDTLKALSGIPFIVSFAPFIDETNALADLILPDQSYLEKWDLDYGIPYLPYLHAALSQPLSGPKTEARHSGDVLLQIAARIGGQVARSLPFKDYFQFIRKEVRALYDSRLGLVPESEFDEFFYAYTQDRGFRYDHPQDFEQFWQKMIASGGWFARPLTETRPRFSTTSAKFEFYSHNLRNALGPKSSDETCIPHFEPAVFVGDEESFPLHFIPFHTITLFDGAAANRPMMLEMVGYTHKVRWDSWAEMNPETASRYGLEDGDQVWIESEAGRIRTRLKLVVAALPDTVNAPIGLGHTNYGKLASGRGINPHELIQPVTSNLNGLMARQATRVRVYKV